MTKLSLTYLPLILNLTNTVPTAEISVKIISPLRQKFFGKPMWISSVNSMIVKIDFGRKTAVNVRPHACKNRYANNYNSDKDTAR